MISFAITTVLSLLFAGIAMIWISDIVIKKSVCQELTKYNYRLISIDDTEDEFTLPALPPVPSWKKHVFLGHTSLAASARNFDYMEVNFITPENKKIKTLIAVRSTFFTSKVYFQIDLRQLKNITSK